jgi:phage shock protein PspC (stress-responsive transcriptional regulator)
MSVAALGAPVIVAVAIVFGAAFVAAARICLQLIMDQESDRGSD